MNDIRSHFTEQLKDYKAPKQAVKPVRSSSSPLWMDWSLVVILLVAAFLIRYPFILARETLLPGDEVMFGLMGNHILQGELPVFYWGQSYLGTIEAYVTAFLSLFLGMSGVTVQLGGYFFYSLFIGTNYFLIKRIFNFDTAFFVSLLLVVAPMMVFQLSFRALGGYSEILFLGALGLLFWIKVFQDQNYKFLFPLGLTLGVALWLNSLFIIYLTAFALMTFYWTYGFKDRVSLFAPWNFLILRNFKISFWLKLPFILVHLFVLLYAAQQITVLIFGELDFEVLGFAFKEPAFKWKGVKKILLLLSGEVLLLSLVVLKIKGCLQWLNKWKMLIIGFALGVAPSVLYSLFGGEGYRLLHGSGAIHLEEFGDKFSYLFLTLIPNVLWGLKWNINDTNLWLGVQVFILTLTLGSFVCYFLSYAKDMLNTLFFRKEGVQNVGFYFCFLCLTVLAITFISALSADRYLIALYWVTAVVVGVFLSRITHVTRGFAAILIIPFLIFNLKAAYVQMDLWKTQTEDLQGLFSYLKEKDLQGGITDYDNSYRFTFYSDEELIFIPLEGIMRRPQYKEFVSKLNRRAFIFPADSPNEAQYLRANPNFKPLETHTYKTFRIYVVGPTFPLP